MDLIARKEYVEWLESYRDKKIIKVVTGLRRVGKSTIFELYIANLLKSGIMTFGFKGNEVGVMMNKRAEFFMDDYVGFAGGVVIKNENI